MVQLVVDASVILKWFFDFPEEENRDKALDLRNKHVSGKISLCIPQYAIYEITNALTFSKYKLSKEIVIDSLEALADLRLKKSNDYSDKKLMKESVELAFKYAITIYDALYLALAKKLECSLLTADEKFIKKVGDKEDNIFLLINY